jgi:hypothetical protein
MVHSWIRLRNNKIVEKCLNDRIIRILKNKDTYFYGDYDLDVYIGTKHDYSNLQSCVAKVIQIGKGWIKNCLINNDEMIGCFGSTIIGVIWQFGSIDEKYSKKILPRRDTGILKKTLVYRNDGNFKMIACETEYFYYVFCFATS